MRAARARPHWASTSNLRAGLMLEGNDSDGAVSLAIVSEGVHTAHKAEAGLHMRPGDLQQRPATKETMRAMVQAEQRQGARRSCSETACCSSAPAPPFSCHGCPQQSTCRRPRVFLLGPSDRRTNKLQTAHSPSGSRLEGLDANLPARPVGRCGTPPRVMTLTPDRWRE